MMDDMTHPLAAVHAQMPSDLRDSSPLSDWPEDAEWTSRRHTADGNGPWCKTDRHAGQKIPCAWSENVSHAGDGYKDLYAFWETCQDCHDGLAAAQSD
jgi:hypothetical protein